MCRFRWAAARVLNIFPPAIIHGCIAITCGICMQNSHKHAEGAGGIRMFTSVHQSSQKPASAAPIGHPVLWLSPVPPASLGMAGSLPAHMLPLLLGKVCAVSRPSWRRCQPSQSHAQVEAVPLVAAQTTRPDTCTRLTLNDGSTYKVYDLNEQHASGTHTLKHRSLQAHRRASPGCQSRSAPCAAAKPTATPDNVIIAGADKAAPLSARLCWLPRSQSK